MSDFLKKFSDGVYEKKEQVEDSHDGEKQTVFQTGNVKEEVYVIDEERKKQKKRNWIVGISSTIVLMLIVFGIWFFMNQVEMPNFVNQKTLNEVQVWATQNHITLDTSQVYHTSIDNGYVVSQSVNEGEKIQKGSVLSVVISKGADPEEHIEIPDFMNMTLTEIESWKDRVKASNVSIVKEFSEEVENAKTIRFTFDTEGIDEQSYRRKDKMTIVVSKGKEIYEKNITMPDFKDKTKSEVETWAQENEVSVVFSEEDNGEVEKGSIISQDIEVGTKIAKKDVVNMVVSRGKIYYAPNFYGLDETMAQVEALKAGVTVNMYYHYSNSVSSGELISQSEPGGKEIDGQAIALLYSLGKPYVSNFDGNDVATMIQSITEMNAQGAQLTYEIQEVDSAEKKGTIVSSNYKANYVDVGSHIVIQISNQVLTQ